MVQTTLNEFFPLQRLPGVALKSNLTFLHLPYSIRRRIYLYSGLLSKSAIYLNYNYSREDEWPEEYTGTDPERWPPNETIAPKSRSLSHFLDGPIPWPEISLDRFCRCCDENWRRCECQPLPHQLLYVSRAIAKEVSLIFYSENHFNICQQGLGGFSGLLSLPSKCLASITSFKICLNEDQHGEEYSTCTCCSLFREGKPLQITKSRRDKSAVKEWQLVCQLLTSSIPPNQLKLSVVCDVANIQSGEEYVSPLLKLPILRECGVRLGVRLGLVRAQSLQKLARQTVEQVTGRLSWTLFRYMDLPQEIRLHILEYTDLITPLDLLRTKRIRPLTDYRIDPFCELRGSCCKRCSDVGGACLCRWRLAAFSTTCTCWIMPVSIFLVSHKMKNDAEFIFYSKNHFIISYWYSLEIGQLEINDFLAAIPKSGRRYLRSVFWKLRPSQLQNIHGREIDHKAWLNVANILTQEINLKQFTLAIEMKWLSFNSYLEIEDWSNHTEDASRIAEVEATCEILTDFLTPLGPLKNLFFHVYGPLRASEINRELEKTYERRVMGDKFDSVVRGKYKRRHRWNG